MQEQLKATRILPKDVGELTAADNWISSLGFMEKFTFLTVLDLSFNNIGIHTSPYPFVIPPRSYAKLSSEFDQIISE